MALQIHFEKYLVFCIYNIFWSDVFGPARLYYYINKSEVNFLVSRNRTIYLPLLIPRGEARPNIVYTYFHFHFHFQVEGSTDVGALSNEFQNNSKDVHLIHPSINPKFKFLLLRPNNIFTAPVQSGLRSGVSFFVGTQTPLLA